MDQKRALTELVGSLAVVYFAIGDGGAMATGLVLAIFMMAMGGTILPMFTLARMATGRDSTEEGALDFLMQLLGGIIASSVADVDAIFADYDSEPGNEVTILKAMTLANQLTINLTQNPDLPNPSGGLLFNACLLTAETDAGSLGDALTLALDY
ncbi:MAG: hypothetical protein MK233_03520, partial [Candidatus Poseidoniales archaeon]|nr:hypothetical protein [Candidatus Poseidoniales archaeon]